MGDVTQVKSALNKLVKEMSFNSEEIGLADIVADEGIL